MPCQDAACSKINSNLTAQTDDMDSGPGPQPRPHSVRRAWLFPKTNTTTRTIMRDGGEARPARSGSISSSLATPLEGCLRAGVKAWIPRFRQNKIPGDLCLCAAPTTRRITKCLDPRLEVIDSTIAAEICSALCFYARKGQIHLAAFVVMLDHRHGLVPCPQTPRVFRLGGHRWAAREKAEPQTLPLCTATEIGVRVALQSSALMP